MASTNDVISFYPTQYYVENFCPADPINQFEQNIYLLDSILRTLYHILLMHK